MNEEQIKQWKEKGYIICDNTIDNIIDNNTIVNSNVFLKDIYKNGELPVKDFGSEGKLEFPSNTMLDDIMINENIIKCAQQLLGTPEILLVQADTWGKLGRDDCSEFSNNNQRMHMDYPHNGFLHPSEWDNPECVGMIIYLSDTKKTGGGTAVVPRINQDDDLYTFPYKNMPGIGEYPFYNDKDIAEEYFKKNDVDVYNFRQELHNREIITQPKMGDILFYRLDLWHRGTPVNKGEIRFVINLLWKKKECFWINCWNAGWSRKMYDGHVERLFTRMTPLQRYVLGIPLPGDKYWDLTKINLLKMRYPDIDIEPYLNELN